MNELHYSALLKQLDKEWLIRACDMLNVEYDGIRGKRNLLNKIFEVLNEDPSMAIFFMNPLMIFKFIDIYDALKGKKMTAPVIKKFIKDFKSSIDSIDMEKIQLEQPKSYFESSVALTNYLLENGHYEAVLKTETYIIDETLSLTIQSNLVWNLICYYGAIEVDTLLEIYQKVVNHNLLMEKDMLSFMLYFIALNINDEVYWEDIDGKEYLLTEAGGINPELILENIQKINVDYKVPTLDEVMSMYMGITPNDYLVLTTYLNDSFIFNKPLDKTEPFNELAFLTSLIISMKNPDGRFINDYLRDEFELEEYEDGLSYIHFINALFDIPRFGYKGYTRAEVEAMDLDVVDETDMEDEIKLASRWVDLSGIDEEDMDLLDDYYEEEVDMLAGEDENIINFITAKKKKKDKFLN